MLTEEVQPCQLNQRILFHLNNDDDFGGFSLSLQRPSVMGHCTVDISLVQGAIRYVRPTIYGWLFFFSDHGHFPFPTDADTHDSDVY